MKKLQELENKKEFTIRGNSNGENVLGNCYIIICYKSCEQVVKDNSLFLEKKELIENFIKKEMANNIFFKVNKFKKNINEVLKLKKKIYYIDIKNSNFNVEKDKYFDFALTSIMLKDVKNILLSKGDMTICYDDNHYKMIKIITQEAIIIFMPCVPAWECKA